MVLNLYPLKQSYYIKIKKPIFKIFILKIFCHILLHKDNGVDKYFFIKKYGLKDKEYQLINLILI